MTTFDLTIMAWISIWAVVLIFVWTEMAGGFDDE